jgi:F420-dependent oxidoreductase-like protein
LKLSTLIYPGERASVVVSTARDLESAGLDVIWLPESYSFDAISRVGYLAACTSRLTIATGVTNVFSRTPSLIAATAAGCDEVTGGRFILGLGASGPQVVEGFHGVRYAAPLTRMREATAICRMAWRREEPIVYSGRVFKVPLPPDEGTGLGRPLKLINHPVRAKIPIYWASLTPASVETMAELADGWLPYLFIPEQADQAFGEALRKGLAKRSPELGALEIVASAGVAIGDNLDRQSLLDLLRPNIALYVGGMGARDKNFYNDLARRYGYEAEAKLIQDLYLDGKYREAEAAVPVDWLEKASLIGPPEYVRERLAIFREAGVTMLSVIVLGDDPVGTIAQLREMTP